MSENVFKMLVVGASGVGKTTIISDIAEYIYKESTQKGATIKNVSYVFRENENIGILGLDYLLKGKIFEDQKYRFHFWDFKGDDKLEDLFNYYFKGASGALVFFDLSRPETFKIALKYIKLIKKLKCPYGVIGAKADLVKEEELKSNINFTKKIRIIHNEGAYFYITASSKSFKKSEDYRTGFKGAIETLLVKIINENILEAFRNDLNLQILIALNVHKELSLADLARYLDKSKATISRKTRFLIKLRLVESREAEFEKTPGSIKKKHYSICRDFGVLPELDDIKSFDLNNLKDIAKFQEEIWRKAYIFSLMYKEFGNSLRNLIQEIPVAAVSKRNRVRKKFIETFLKTSMNLRYLNERQYEKLQTLRSEFHSKLNKILEDDDGIKKDYVYVGMVLPILQMKELEAYHFLNEKQIK